MESIPVTTNHSEMIEIGKALFLEHKEFYSNEVRLRSITDVIDAEMPNATREEKQDVFFRSLYDYWVYGNSIKEEFGFDFANKTHEEKMEYITYRNRFLYMYHLNDPQTRHILDNKWEAYNLMKRYYRRDAIVIRDESDYDAFCAFVKEHPRFVVKPLGMSGGKGVHKESAENTDAKTLFRQILDERGELTAKYHYGNASAMMLEEMIVQAPEMARLHPASVQSIRLVTIRTGDKVHFWYPRLHIGVKGDFQSNAAAGGITALVDPETGIVTSHGWCKDGSEYEIHPDTDIPIRGLQMPAWEELVDIANDLMRNVVPEIRYVGWDLAYSDKGWCIIEGNWAGEFVGDQLSAERGLRKELEALIGWKPQQTYWWQA